MKKIKIKAPFYGAGSPSQYNWVKDGYEIFGVGINVKDINAEKTLEVIVDGHSYVVKTDDIKTFVRKYNSVRSVKNSLVRLGVFSISLLKGVRGDETMACCPSFKTFSTHSSDCPTIEKPIVSKQATLF